MKLSLSKKLIGGFVIVTILTAILGGVGIYSITNLSNSTQILIDDTIPSVTTIMHIDSLVEKLVVNMKELQTPGMPNEEYNKIVGNIDSLRTAYKEKMEDYSQHLPPGSEAEKLFEEYKAAINEWRSVNERYMAMRETLHELDLGNPETLRTELEIFRGDHYKRVIDVSNMLSHDIKFEGGERDDVCNFGKWLINTKTTNKNLNEAIEKVKTTHKQFHNLIASSKNYYNEGDKSKAQEAAEQLNELVDEFLANIQLIRTEIVKGQDLLHDLHTLLETEGTKTQTIAENIVKQIVDAELEQANNKGEETKEIASFSTFFTIVSTGVIAVFAIAFGIFLSMNITRPIFKVITELNNNADQVEDAAGQVSTSSQQLAQGATEQAAGLEETSGSIQDMAVMVKQNAENTQQANVLASSTTKSARQGTESMKKMNEAIGKIQASSEETSKIIKVIDEIAFQTNLLALNAAVEAARAGEAGKGFAVVAEEVRNLAMRSAEAARNTSYMIEESVANSNNGVEICKEVDQNLVEITESVEKVAGLLNEVDSSCQEQTMSIEQISRAMIQMDKVTQSNAASSEEGASAAEELSAQAEQMKLVVGDLLATLSGRESTTKAMSSGDRYNGLPHSDAAFHEIAQKSPEQTALDKTFA